MKEQALPVRGDGEARPVFAVRPDGLDAFLNTLSPESAAFLKDGGFAAQAQQMVLLPGGSGISGAVLGLGADRSPHAFGDLAFRLPAESLWRVERGDFSGDDAELGFCLGAYRYRGFKAPKREPALLVSDGNGRATQQAAAIWMVRDLVNAPANLLGPAELADAGAALGARFGARVTRCEGGDLENAYPTVAAVGRGSARPPVVLTFEWQGSEAQETSPLVSLCGKGVCFDTGGYDLKPSAGMLRMKKDMGGAANVLGLARMVMEADLPVRLAVRIGCVENSISGEAMRPLDVVRTRKGLTVEIGNTDAEGRLILCDLLDEASEAKPALLVDCATLTGAARVAVGPDLPALFSNDEAWAEQFCVSGTAVHDPMWRLPLFDGYDSWLDSSVADLNNVSSKPMAGAVTAALFLRRFVPSTQPWVHLDMYSWNDSTRPGRPEGGEAQAIRAVFHAIEAKLVLTCVK